MVTGLRIETSIPCPTGVHGKENTDTHGLENLGKGGFLPSSQQRKTSQKDSFLLHYLCSGEGQWVKGHFSLFPQGASCWWVREASPPRVVLGLLFAQGSCSPQFVSGHKKPKLLRAQTKYRCCGTSSFVLFFSQAPGELKARSQRPTCQLLQLILGLLDSGTRTEVQSAARTVQDRMGTVGCGHRILNASVCAQAGSGSHSGLLCTVSLASKCDFNGASFSLSLCLRSEIFSVKNFPSS